MVSYRPTVRATISLVPTPSMLLTSTGSSQSRGTLNSPPKWPISERTSGPQVSFTSRAIARVASFALSMSTPESR